MSDPGPAGRPAASPARGRPAAPPTAVVPLGPARVEPAAALLARAFADDPVWCALVPDGERRSGVLTRFFAASLRTGLAAGQHVTTTPDLGGVALWSPPGGDAGIGAVVRSGLAVPRVLARLSTAERRPLVRLLTTRREGDGWLVAADGGRATYRFRARRYALEHWVVDPASIERTVDGEARPPDALALVAELADTLAIPAHPLGLYLEEISATLAAAAWKRHHERIDSAGLVHASFQEIESAMTEGHPGFVANSGRIGFGLADHEAYAPEAARPVRLLWLAARREHAPLSLGDGVDEHALYEGQLGADTLARFADQLRRLGLDPGDYRYLPAHPWQ